MDNLPKPTSPKYGGKFLMTKILESDRAKLKKLAKLRGLPWTSDVLHELIDEAMSRGQA